MQVSTEEAEAASRVPPAREAEKAELAAAAEAAAEAAATAAVATALPEKVWATKASLIFSIDVPAAEALVTAAAEAGVAAAEVDHAASVVAAVKAAQAARDEAAAAMTAALTPAPLDVEVPTAEGTLSAARIAGLADDEVSLTYRSNHPVKLSPLGRLSELKLS